MSYAGAAALQRAVFAQLRDWPDLAGVAVVDALPAMAPGSFVLIGPEEARDASDGSGAGAEHLLQIAVISDAAGFSVAKGIAAAISEALAVISPVLERGRLVSFSFVRARARRLNDGQLRRIDLTYRARIAL